MEIRFLGATGTVTGSKYLLRSGRASVRWRVRVPDYPEGVELG